MISGSGVETTLTDSQFVLALGVFAASCSETKTEEVKTDSTTVAVDTAAVAVDTTAAKVDSTVAKVDSAAKK